MEWVTRNPWEDRPIDREKVIDLVPDGPYLQSSWSVHGCDGCCGRADFPGSAAGAISHALMEYYAEEDEVLLRDLKSDHFVLWWGLMAALAEGLRDDTSV
jgi:hypothetical protein